MKRLVIVGEGHGDCPALPVLVTKFLEERGCQSVYVDKDVIRFGSSRVLRRNKLTDQPDYSEWIKAVTLASRRRDLAGVLAVYDGDLKFFPPGSDVPFCAARVARSLANATVELGAGTAFSLCVVFACSEYETWLVASVDSLKGRKFGDGRLAMKATAAFPPGDPESHGKRWLEQHCPNYRPSRDQRGLTQLMDLSCVRARNLRSFRRLEHAVEQILDAVEVEKHVVTPL